MTLTTERVVLICAALAFTVLMTLVSFNAYWKSQERILYKQCLELTEKMLKENKNYSTPYCRM